SIHFVSGGGIPMVAPFHGRDSRLGTNPLCVGFPRKDDFSLVLDYATSAISFGKTRVARHGTCLLYTSDAAHAPSVG
ncbi:Ldh family oxidoreductase, partial [Escherichia coli]|nr:Ldh family oxidoreductase [Escherichia coli]